MTTPTLTIAEAVDSLMRDGMPVRFTAYDGSSAGPPDAAFGLELTTPRGLAYLLTAPGDLGMARAYVTGDLLLTASTPATPTRHSSTCRTTSGSGRRPRARWSRSCVRWGSAASGHRPRRRRRRSRGGAARSRGCATPRVATPR